MSINFPLFLLLSTAITGAIWLIDILLLRPKRRANLEQLNRQSVESTLVMEEARQAVMKEPVVV